jgi:hypothetical protein
VTLAGGAGAVVAVRAAAAHDADPSAADAATGARAARPDQSRAGALIEFYKHQVAHGRVDPRVLVAL